MVKVMKRNRWSRLLGVLFLCLVMAATLVGSSTGGITAATTPPTVSTVNASSITAYSATLNGALSSLGTASSVQVSFEWGLTADYGVTTTAQAMNTTVAFTFAFSGLIPGTTYHFRAKAVGEGISYGSDKTFTTLSSTLPTVSTANASTIANYSATLNGTLSSLGTAASVQVSFEWGLTDSYGLATTAQARPAIGAFTSALSGLIPGTTYHFRAKAVGNGTCYGSDMTFTALSITAPAVTSAAATGVGATTATLNGSLTSLGTASSVQVSFEWGPTGCGVNTTAQAKTAIGAFAFAVSGLLPGTTYHFKAKAVGNGTVYGDDMTFTTPATTAPAVTSAAATGLGTTTATLNGNLTSLGTASSVQVSFEWGLTGSYGVTTTTQAKTATGAFTFAVSGLVPGATYHFRAQAMGNGAAYGDDMTFATLATTAPAVTSAAATGAGTTTATLNGNLTSLGTASSVQVSFEWGPTGYGVTTTTQAKTATGAFTFAVSGLVPGTTYHFRAKAVGDDTSYGSDMTFATLATTAPAVTSAAATGVGTTTATLNGNLTSLGTASPVQVSFEWGLTGSYGVTTTAQAKTTTGTFTFALSGLIPGTTYHFKAKGVGNGPAYGDDVTFTTSLVTTSAATGIGPTVATLNGNLTSLGSATSVTVSFEYGTTTAYGTVTAGVVKTSTGVFSAPITGLTTGTIYHFRAKAVGDATTYGSDMSFTSGTTLPAVTSTAVTGVGATTATLNGNLTSLGSATSVTVSFEYGPTTAYDNVTTGVVKTSTGVFSAPITGLTTGTIYHFRAKVVGDGTAYGSDVGFTPGTTPSAVTSTAATGLGTTTATLNGNLTSLGASATVYVAFEWGLTTDYGVATTWQGRTTTGAFTSALSGLVPGTTYHFRAKAATSGGTSYGSDMTFATLAATAPTVSTVDASGITAYSATLNGTLSSLGTASPVYVAFEWGPTGYGVTTTYQAKTTIGAFTFALSGLVPGTTYHFRAKAVGDGTPNGSDMTFTTLAATAPAVTSSAATGLGATTATLNGNLTSLGTASPVYVSFEWGLTDSYGVTTTLQARTTTGAFTFALSGLLPGTTYHFRAKAVGDGTPNGSDMTFTTLATTTPAVTSVGVTGVGATTATLNGNLTSLGTASPVYVSFEWGLTGSYGVTTTWQARTTIGAFTFAVSGLVPGTTYHFRAKAMGDGTSNGSDVTFTTLSTTLPIVSTANASSVASYSATLNGTLSSLGTTSPVYVTFEWGLTDSYGVTTTWQAMTAIGAFTFAFSGLLPGTTYHFRAMAVGDGTSYGSDMTFTAPSFAAPAVSSTPATGVGTTTATLNGNVTSLGTGSPVYVSFEWGPTGYGVTTTAQAKTAVGAFTFALSGLVPGTTYHFTAKAVGDGTSYGDDMTFTTLAATAPAVTSAAATGVGTATTATLNGNLTSLGTAASVQVSFEWGPTGYGVTTTAQAKTTIGAFTFAVSGLTPGITYHFRAKAVGNDTSYGSDMTFAILYAPVDLLCPADVTATSDNTPFLDWTDATDISGPRYQLQVDNNTDFLSPELEKADLTTSEYTPTADEDLPDGIYYWRVRSVDDAAYVGAWSSWSFAVDTIPPYLPSFISPVNGAKLNDNTPLLDWSDVSDPTGVAYRVQVDNDSDFSSPVLDNPGLTTSEYTLSEALGDGVYYWRVRVVDGAGNEGDWSGAWSFTVDTVTPAVPDLAQPANGKYTNDNTPWLDWTTVTDASAVYYQVQVDNDADFSSPVLSKTYVTGSWYTVAAGEALSDGVYNWRVKAVDKAGNGSAWTSSWSFTVDTVTPAVPDLVQPANGKYTNDNTPWLDWTTVTDASPVYYQVQVDNDADFSSPVLSKTYVTGSSYTVAAGEALSDGVYYWRVKALDKAGNGSAWTSPRSFRVDTVAAAPSLVSPTDGKATGDNTPFLDWSTVSDPSVIHYQVQVDDNSDFSSPVLSKTWVTASYYTLTAGEARSDGTYYWRVRAVDALGNVSDWTTGWSFTVDTVAPAVPSLVSPGNGANTNDTTPWLDWSTVTDPSGVHYQLQVDDNSDFSSPAVSKTWVTASNYTLSAGEALSPGTYYYRVRAMDGVGNASDWTSSWSFTVVVP